MYVEVNGNLERALKIFNKKVKEAGIIKECKIRSEYMKPSEKKKWKKEEAIRKRIKEERRQKKKKSRHKNY